MLPQLHDIRRLLAIVRRQGRVVAELAHVQIVVKAAGSQQFVVRAALDDLALV